MAGAYPGMVPFRQWQQGPMEPARSSAADVWVGGVPNFLPGGLPAQQCNVPYLTFAAGNQLPQTDVTPMRHAGYVYVTSQDNRQPLRGIQASFGVNLPQRSAAALIQRMRALWATASNLS